MMIERLHTIDPSQFLELYFQTHKHMMSRAVFQWKHLDNPHGRTTAWVSRAVEGGPWTGLAAVMPRKVQIGDQVVVAGQCSDFMVHPDHQRQGIISALIDRQLADREAAGFDLLFTLPNPETHAPSAHTFYKNTAFREVGRYAPWRRYWAGRTFLPRVLKSRMVAALADPVFRLWTRTRDRLHEKPMEWDKDGGFESFGDGFVIDRDWLAWRRRAPDLKFVSIAWDKGGALLRIDDGTAQLYSLAPGKYPARALRTLLDAGNALGLDALYLDGHFPYWNNDLKRLAGLVRSKHGMEVLMVAGGKALDNDVSLTRGDIDVP